MGFGNIEHILTTYLSAATGVRTVTKLPGNLQEVMPLHRVLRASGADNGLTDFPTVDLETFAPDRTAMWQHAEAAREAMRSLAGHAVNGWLVDTVTTLSAPTWLDYGNPAIERAVAVYQLTLRRR